MNESHIDIYIYTCSACGGKTHCRIYENGQTCMNECSCSRCSSLLYHPFLSLEQHPTWLHDNMGKPSIFASNTAFCLSRNYNALCLCRTKIWWPIVMLHDRRRSIDGSYIIHHHHHLSIAHHLTIAQRVGLRYSIGLAAHRFCIIAGPHNRTGIRIISRPVQSCNGV